MPADKINRYPVRIEGQEVQIGTANELAIALDVLQGQYDRETLQQLQDHLAEIIAHASGFITVIRSLSVDDQIFLTQAIGSGLVNVIQTASRLRDILAIVADAHVKQAILSTLGSSGLRRLLMTGEELAEVLEWVYGKQDELLLDLLGEKDIRRLCRHADSLSAVLHNIDFDLQARLLEQLGWPFILNLVQDGRDLAYLLRSLPPQNSEKLLNHFSGPRLVELIGSADEWAYLYQRLEPAEANFLLNLLNHHSK
jgi:hypothetical protein